MSYRPPVFYFAHAARDGSAARGTFNISSAFTVGGVAQLFDSLLDVAATLTDTLLIEPAFWRIPLDGGARSQALDALIVAGHNWNGADVAAQVLPSANSLLSAPHLVTVADGVPFSVAFDQNTPYAAQTSIEIGLSTNGGAEDATVPSTTQLFLTQEREMVRGPAPGWDHPWIRSQARFGTPGGVSHAWQTGIARKTFQLEWENLSGADLQIQIDLREQTSNYAHPFFFLPPDTTHGLLFVEVFDSSWEQSYYGHATPGHNVSLSMREVLG